MKDKLVEMYGESGAANIKHVECFEISEYGEAPTEEFLRAAQAAE